MSHWDTNEKLRAHAIGQTISRNWDSVDKTQKKHMFWAYWAGGESAPGKCWCRVCSVWRVKTRGTFTSLLDRRWSTGVRCGLPGCWAQRDHGWWRDGLVADGGVNTQAGNIVKSLGWLEVSQKSKKLEQQWKQMEQAIGLDAPTGL